MHTFEFENVTIFHHNDIRSTALVSIQTDDSGTRIDVPQHALIAYVADLVANERVSILEQAEPHEVLAVRAPFDARPPLRRK